MTETFGRTTATPDLVVRPAAPAELPSVANVLDGAALAVDIDWLRTVVEAGSAGDGTDDGDDRPGRGAVLVAAIDGRVLGALALDGPAIRAVAVRPGRRGQGIGTALVAAAADRRERLVADSDPRVEPFWASLGFAVRRRGERVLAVR
jgi:GNAT superfamily N-acetyltransferase